MGAADENSFLHPLSWGLGGPYKVVLGPHLEQPVTSTSPVCPVGGHPLTARGGGTGTRLELAGPRRGGPGRPPRTPGSGKR